MKIYLKYTLKLYFIGDGTMAKKRITEKDIVKMLNGSGAPSKRTVLKALKEAGLFDFEEDIESIYARAELNNKFNKMLNIDIQCPHCGKKHIIKHGYTNSGLSKYKCKDCNKIFTILTNSIFDNSKYSLDIWADLIKEMMEHHPIREILSNLKEKYPNIEISKKTSLNMRLKIMELTAEIQDEYFIKHPFEGTVYMDEKFFIENQSGIPEKKMFNAYHKDKVRKARHYSMSMEHGVMTNDFSSVLCIMDKNNRIYAKLTVMGKTTMDCFYKDFVPKMNLPNIEMICSDGQDIFRKFCDVENIPQCTILSPYYKYKNKIKKIRSPEKRMAYEKKLYNQGKLGHLYVGDNQYPYETYKAITESFKLNLTNVNGFHGKLETIINGRYKGVPTKNLDKYVNWIAFLRNWELLGHPNKNRQAAIEIMQLLIRYQRKITIEEIDSKSIKDITRPTKAEFRRIKYINSLGQIRYYDYKMIPEDNIERNKKEILKHMSTEEMREFSKFNKIRNYTKLKKTELKKLILKQKKFDEMMAKWYYVKKKYQLN